MARNFKINFLISLSAIVLSMLLMEAIFQIIAPPRLFKAGTIKAPKAKLYGWAPLPSSREVFLNPDTGEKWYFTTNSQGWRDVEHSFEKPEGTIRILFLGDSNTWGYVPLDDLYTRQAEFLLKERGFKNIEVISIGVGGWGTDQLSEALEKEGIKYKPDIVIYQFCDNDIIDNLAPFKTADMDGGHWEKVFKYKFEGGVLKKIELHRSETKMLGIKAALLKSALVYNISKMKNKSIDNMLSITHLNNKGSINPLFTTYRDNAAGEDEALYEGWKLFEQLVLKMKLDCEKNSAKFIIFAQTGEEDERIWNMKWNSLQTDGASDFIIWRGKKYIIDIKLPLKHLAEICKKNNITLIEPKRQYNRYKYDPHPDKEGNRNMAFDIADFLVNQGLLLK